MSFKITKLTIGKGKTTGDEKAGSARALTVSGTEQQKQGQEHIQGSTKLPFDASKIAWQKRTGEKGEFELSEDLNNPDHKALLQFLNVHAGGRVTSEGYFYWVFQNGSTIGRKPRRK